MQINVQGKNIELTEEINEYALKRVTNLDKLIKNLEEKSGEASVRIDLQRTTNHHRAGDVFQADCSISINGQDFYGSAEAEDIYAAIDAVKENLFREITKNKDRKQTLYKRGASSVKKMMKGLSKRNPFTSKY